ncbi:MAG: excinuclease ABC subunit UvrB [Candidatus Paceibacterota bacterium]|jgi:excinuclease ABC subunit B
MSQNKFKIRADYAPAGDQPNAIEQLVEGIKKGFKKQTLFGVTGSGKTFTVANVIQQIQKPTLVIAHNKTLAAQLAQEYKEFFPDNAVHYFVSYYDYYQPEAYMPVTDTYIEKEAMINEEIDRLRHASTQALLTRKDVIIVASVSCIYGLGSPKEYEKVNLKLKIGDSYSRQDLVRKLISVYFERTNSDIKSGTFRAVSNSIEVMPVNEKIIIRIDIENDEVSAITRIDSVSRNIVEDNIQSIFIFPAKHFITDKEQQERAFKSIKAELEKQLEDLKKEGKNLEAERLRRRTTYDLALIKEVGYCNGIENYSRHFSGKNPGEAPDSLLEYFPKKEDGTPDFLTVIDESHVAVSQIRGMYAGDASRKKTLIDYGFRLPSAKDNRPLKFDEFEERINQVIFTSATPGDYERENSEQIVEQVIRPTGLIDPVVEIRPITEVKNKNKSQVFDFIDESLKVIKGGGRVIATTLTKKMAEDLSEYLKEKGVKAEYLHSEIKTIDRIEILTSFRRGKFDCLVGVNLLREGLDLPEVEFIGILDADKEGFLRSDTSLIQTIGRAARNVAGRVVLYADRITGSIERALEETNRRRDIQIAYNKKNGITPRTIIKAIKDITEHLRSDHDKAVQELLRIDEVSSVKNPEKLIRQKEIQMNAAVKILDFESASILRDEILLLKEKIKVMTPKVKTIKRKK